MRWKDILEFFYMKDSREQKDDEVKWNGRLVDSIYKDDVLSE